MASTTLLLTIALLGMASIPLASASWDDCKTTKMILKNSWIHSNIDVISYSRLASGLSVTDCMRKCRSNQECYSFNYNKLTKWCYLGTTEEANLRRARSSKWAAGYRRCVEHIDNNAWTNDEFSGGIPTTVPDAPAIGTFTAISATEATGTWTAPAFDGDAAITSYDIQCTNSVLPSDVVTDIGVPASSACTGSSCSTVITGLTSGATYTCKVRAVNSVGPSLYSSASSSLVMPAAATVPGAPTIGVFTFVSNSDTDAKATATGTWTAPAFDGGDAITSYDIECTNSVLPSDVVTDIGVPAAAVCTGSSCSHSISGLSSGATYNCRVRAVNSVGPSLYSSTTAVTIPVME
ncbi:hypothetical protein Ndes2526B_g02955 [Nannochloris sp. 'desiccata']